MAVGAAFMCLGISVAALASGSDEDTTGTLSNAATSPTGAASPPTTATPGHGNLALVEVAPGEAPDWAAIQAAAALAFSPPANLPDGFRITGVRYPIDALARPEIGRFVMIFISEEGGGTVLQVGPPENHEGDPAVTQVEIGRTDVKVFTNGTGAYYLTGAPDGRGYFAGHPAGSSTTEQDVVAILLSILR